MSARRLQFRRAGALVPTMKFARLLLIVPLVFCTGAAKRPSLDLRIHGTGTAAEAPTFAFPSTLMNGTPVFLQRLPLLTQREVSAVYPFAATDGTQGIYLKLGAHGSRLLQQHTMSRPGTILVVLLNGRQVSNLLVDRPVDDGIVCVPRGLTPEEAELLSISFPVIGQEGKK